MGSLGDSVSETEESGSIPTPLTETETKKDERRRFLSSAMRDLSEEELESPAARRFLIAEIQRLDNECDSSKHILNQYNDLRVETATLREKSKRDRWLELLSFVSTSVGSVGIGAAPTYMIIESAKDTGIVIAICSALLVASGILFRVLK